MKQRGRRRIPRIAKWPAIAGVSVVAAAAAFVYSGLYDVSATNQHTPPVYWAMEVLMRRSVSARADEGIVEQISKAPATEAGFRLYEMHCVQCHGAPGIAPEPFALGMMPVPASLIATGRTWSAADIHWVVTYGVKMTGMPAWRYRMSDEEILQVAAFVKNELPLLSVAQYRERMKQRPSQPPSAPVTAATASTSATAATSFTSVKRLMPEGAIPPGDPDAGRRAMHQHACATCHVIPGITGATQEVGPPLRGMGGRAYIAGLVPNTTTNMVRWLMFPQQVSVRTAMPDLGLKLDDARDMAAYLATLTTE